jgi:CDP-diacylglycerol--inositol 3-phosphatidyltransferase
MQMYSSLTSGAESHKSMSVKDHWLLRLYYTNKTVLFLVCALDQLCYICGYLLSWRDPASGLLLGEFKAVDVTGGKEGAVESGALRMMLWVLFGFSGLFCVLKQVTNVIQLVGASQSLASVDLRSRAKGKEKAK